MTVAAIAALLGATAADVAGTFALERGHDRHRTALRVAAVGAFALSLALYAVALVDLHPAVAESLFVAVGTAAVAVVAARRGELSACGWFAIAALVIGVVLLQIGELT